MILNLSILYSFYSYFYIMLSQYNQQILKCSKLKFVYLKIKKKYFFTRIKLELNISIICGLSNYIKMYLSSNNFQITNILRNEE